MKIVETYEEGEYTINVYDNGTKEKFLTSNPPRILKPPILTESQAVAYQTATNTEMLLALAEMGGI